ncbi:MAG TPA: hypothetical protein VFI30_05800 [Nocardioidaceae bacterium]|nr:hypothetical protein [Nocardioidaceae bacterium]
MKHWKGTAMASAVGLSLAAIAIASAAIAGSDQASPSSGEADHGHVTLESSGRQAGRTLIAASSPSGDGIVAPVVGNQPCDLHATPTLATGTDQRLLDAAESNPASQPDSTSSGLNLTAAVNAARVLSSVEQSASAAGVSGPALDSIPAAAVEVPYQVGDGWIGGHMLDNSLVALDRCVWMVAVQAQFQPSSAPASAATTSFSTYTVMFDSASGEYLGLGAGTDAFSLITGQGASSAATEQAH